MPVKYAVCMTAAADAGPELALDGPGGRRNTCPLVSTLGRGA